MKNHKNVIIALVIAGVAVVVIAAALILLIGNNNYDTNASVDSELVMGPSEDYEGESPKILKGGDETTGESPKILKGGDETTGESSKTQKTATEDGDETTGESPKIQKTATEDGDETTGESPSTSETDDEKAQQEALAWQYGAWAGRVSLDQELFPTTIGEKGRFLIANQGEVSQVQQSILDACSYVGAAPAHYCAAWISSVYSCVGVSVGGNANDMWADYCYSNSLDELEPGMIIATQHSRTDEESDGYIYGHVGIYIGDGYVISSTTVQGEGTKVITSIDDWISRYDPYETVLWGFPDGV